jgi:hypothetical protein
MNVLPYLDSHAEDDLREVVRRSKTNTAHISRDTCDCGGDGCDHCRNCPCPRCDPYVPEYVRASVKKWRPAS